MTPFDATQSGSLPWLAALLDATAKGLAILIAASAATWLLRRQSAALRHLVWTLSVIGLMVVPVLSVALPQWQVPILPGWAGPEVPMHAPPPAPAEPGPSDWPTVVAGTSAPFDVPRAGPMTDIAPEQSAPSGPVAAVQPAPTPPIHWSTWALLAWLVGAAAMAIPLAVGTVTVWRQVCQARRITDENWLALLARLRQTLGVRMDVKILRSGRSNIPLTCGTLRPAILLPAEADGWSADRRRVVLLHELAHVKRADCLTQMIARLARVLYWFNPLVWLAGRMLRIERERACDDLVLAAGHKASDYASHLLEIVRTLRSQRCPSLAAVAMARRSQFEGRMLAILDPRRNRRALTRWGALAAAILVAGIVVPLACLKATGDKPASAPESPAETSKETAAAAAAPPPAVRDASPQATQPADLETLGDTLAKKVGGRWGADLHNAFPQSLRVLRGQFKSADGKTLAVYVVFPFGRDNVEQQRVLWKAYEHARGARIIGWSRRFTAVETATDPTSSAAHVTAIIRALDLSPLAWRDEESQRLAGLSSQERVGQLGPPTAHANPEGPDGVVGHFYKELRPGAVLVIRELVRPPSVCDVYWADSDSAGLALYNPPPPGVTTQPETQPTTTHAPSAPEPPAAAPAGGQQDAKANLMNWVEDFFAHNYRDITARQTLEWGEVQKEQNGNLSIRYKYLATIWDKDKFVIEEQYTFSPDGKFVSVKSLSKVPAAPGAPASPAKGEEPLPAARATSTQPVSDAEKAQLVNWVEDFFSKNYRDITARKTLEWGQPQREPSGNLSTRYKFLATIWDKDKLLIEQRFTFTPQGKFVSAETLEKGPAAAPPAESEKAAAPATSPPDLGNTGGAALTSGQVPTLAQLQQAVQKSELLLHDVKVESHYSAESWDEGKQQWQRGGEAEATAWLIGVPGSRVRIDFHRRVYPWLSGAAPFYEEQYSIAYNGQVGQKHTSRGGAPKNPVLMRSGSIQSRKPDELCSNNGEGSLWKYSLYGVFDEGGYRFSEMLAAADNPAFAGYRRVGVKPVQFNGVDCLEVRDTRDGSRESWYLDPRRGYAFLGYEGVTATGVVTQRVTVQRLVEPAPGVYYPGAAKRELFTSEGVPRCRQSFEASAVVANDPHFTEAVFTITWPEGTMITDEKGQQYVVGKEPAAPKAAKAAESSWGEAVEGVQVGLRADKRGRKAGESPIFDADVRNNGKLELTFTYPLQGCEVEVDGRVYRWRGEQRTALASFGPNREYRDLHIDLDSRWQDKETGRPVELPVGKHTVRVAFIAEPQQRGQGQPVRAISNPVEIEIFPAAAPAAETHEFGPVIERTVEEIASGNSAIDLDTGKLYSGPSVDEKVKNPTVEYAKKVLDDWLKATGVDAVGMVSSATHGLSGFDMVVMAVENDRWNTSSAELTKLLGLGKPGTPAEMSGKGELPATYYFKTREGGMGVLQIIGFITDIPKGVKIRYKLVQQTAATPPVAPAAGK